MGKGSNTDNSEPHKHNDGTLREGTQSAHDMFHPQRYPCVILDAACFRTLELDMKHQFALC
eukprot:1154724-Pelagomonas_calceolata.AAC.1